MRKLGTILWAVVAVQLVSLGISGVALAQEEGGATKPEPVDPTGSWKWEYTFNDNPAEFQLELNWNGRELTGKYTAFDNTTDIEEAKFENNELSFISKREFNGNEFTVQFDGKAEANDIAGTVAVDFGEGPREFDWHAKRVVDTDNVLGVWKLKLDTPNGVIEPEITITKEGDKLHGDYISPFGEREAKDVMFKDGELSWRIESDEDDEFDFEVHYRGKPRGNTISGTNEFDFGGNTGTMEFTGTRTPPKEKDAAEAAPDQESAAAEPKPAAAAAATDAN
jgi:hypothetical protein